MGKKYICPGRKQMNLSGMEQDGGYGERGHNAWASSIKGSNRTPVISPHNFNY